MARAGDFVSSLVGGRLVVTLATFSMLSCSSRPASETPVRTPAAIPESRVAPRVFREGAPRAVENSSNSHCVSLAAPPSGFLVRAKGEAYVLSADGYLHSFGASLEHRFSFSLEGLPIGIVEVGEGVLVSTSSRIFTSVHARGAERYHFRVLSRPHFGPSIDANENLYFVGADRFVYSVSSHGVAHFRVEMKSEPIGAPLVSSAGRVWVPLREGLVELDGAREPRWVVRSKTLARAQLGPGGIWFEADGKLGRTTATGPIAWEENVVAWDAKPEGGVFATPEGTLAVRSAGNESEFRVEGMVSKLFVARGETYAAFGKVLRGYGEDGRVIFEEGFPGEISEVRRAGRSLFVLTGDGRLCQREN